jgi:outer membrane protein OmpA-like peptidoglycan-associated protein
MLPASGHTLSRSAFRRLIGQATTLLGGTLLVSACVSGTSVGIRIDPRAMALASPADTALYMETQALELQQLLAESGSVVVRERENIILRLQGIAAFAPDQTQVNPEFAALLVDLAAILTAYDRTHIDVIGYTDATGPMVGNMALSINRAEAVAALLQSQGLPAERISARGLGPLQPLGGNDTPAGRQLNRRVELTIRPLPEPALAADPGE